MQKTGTSKSKPKLGRTSADGHTRGPAACNMLPPSRLLVSAVVVTVMGLAGLQMATAKPDFMEDVLKSIVWIQNAADALIYWALFVVYVLLIAIAFSIASLVFYALNERFGDRVTTMDHSLYGYDDQFWMWIRWG